MSTQESFKLASVSTAGCEPFAALIRDDRAVAVTALARLAEQCGKPLAEASTLPRLLDDWERNLAALKAVVAAASSDDGVDRELPYVPLDALRVHAPVPAPRQVFCTGANYRKHVIDYIVDSGGGPETEHLSREDRRKAGEKLMDERAATGTPYAFVKASSSVTGPYDPVVLPDDVKQPDWELEIAVVFGKPGRHLTRENAMSIVAGYAVANDISARDLIFRRDIKALGTDWLLGKSAPGFLPLGPFLVPAEFVADPHDLHLLLKLNGETMQDEHSDDMIFDIPRQIEYLSRHVQILPGDVMLTGSPAGNGVHHNRFLRDGDVMEASITGLGTQRTPCIATGA
ncbi:fumarylacetoacetate hydrolase family protein [Paraburkholderia fungorum]